MQRNAALAVLAAICWLVTAAAAQAGVLFFVDDEPGFAAATASYVPMGSEDWSSAGSAPSASVSDPLQPGVAKGPFPNGVAAATGMTVQSNSLGSAAATVAPGGNMFYAPSGFTGVSGATQPSNQLSANVAGHGFDLLFAPVGDDVASAVALSPMFYRVNGAANAGTVTVKVFGTGGAELGSTTVPNVADVSEASFVGVVVTEPDALGRIHLWANTTDVAGADNIDVYTVPEPVGAAGGFTAIAALVARRRRAPGFTAPPR